MTAFSLMSSAALQIKQQLQQTKYLMVTLPLEAELLPEVECWIWYLILPVCSSFSSFINIVLFLLGLPLEMFVINL